MEKSDKKGFHNPTDVHQKPDTIPFTVCDLPVDTQGGLYHIQAKPSQIAPDIIIVGDPGRAEFIGNTFFQDVEFSHEHRGLATVTGTAKLTGEMTTVISPLRATVTTSGIGTPSLEIVVNELVALFETDMEKRVRKQDHPKINVIRVGTSGGLQTSTKLGTAIITTYAIGLDNTGLYYETPYPDVTCRRLENEVDQVVKRAMNTKSRFYGKIHPYVSRADPLLVDALVESAERLGLPYKKGLTTSAPGFFLPQGREIPRISPSVSDLDKIFAEFDPGLPDQKVENMEMEASFLMHFLGGLGHRAGAICLAIANRQSDTFIPTYVEDIRKVSEAALLALAILRNK